MIDLNSIQLQQTAKGLGLIRNELEGKWKFSTSLGAEDQVITHWIASQNIDIPIFTLDTGRLFEKTYEVLHRTQSKYILSIETFFPEADDIKKYVSENGVNGFYNSIEQRKSCCFIRKVAPLQKALKGVNFWVSGLRKEQSENRDSLQPIMWDDQFQLYKVYPLLDWTWDEVMHYLDQNNVPYNQMHKNGYPSIGCEPCTRAIEKGEDFRSGRWWWEQSHKECGLHQISK